MIIEKSILASFLCDSESTQFITLLNDDNFTSIENKEIFKCVYNLYKDDNSVDAVNLIDRLPHYQNYIYDLINNVVHTVNVENHIKQLRENTIRKKLKEQTEKLYQNLDNKEKQVNNSLGEFLNKINDTSIDSTIVSNKDVAKRFIIDFEKRAKEKNDNIIRTGYKELDNLVFIKPGNIYVIAARPSMGKTAYAINLAINFAEEKKRVLIISLEMPIEEIIERQISKIGRVSYSEVQDAKRISNMGLVNVTKALKKIMELDILFEEKLDINIDELCVTCRRLKAQNKIDIIIIDYIQLIMSTLKYGTSNDRLSDITRKLKLLAMDLKIPIIELCQLNRDIEKRTDPTPLLSDLRDSGSVEQDADAVLFITGDKETNEREIIVAKNRKGPLGKFNISFLGNFQEFV